MDIRINLLKIISKEHPLINTILGDCEKKIDFEMKVFSGSANQKPQRTSENYY